MEYMERTVRLRCMVDHGVPGFPNQLVTGYVMRYGRNKIAAEADEYEERPFYSTRV